MICPVCNNALINKTCSNEDHLYMLCSIDNLSWFILHNKTQLFIDKNRIAFNDIDGNIVKFEKEITTDEAVIILNKYIRLQAFL